MSETVSNDALIARVLAERPDWLRRILGRLNGYPHAERCWLWPTDSDNYGRVHIPRAMGVNASAVVHRVVWLALVGSIAEGLVLDHDGPDGCSNRGCAMQWCRATGECLCPGLTRVG